jgi:hypothetical protein
LRGWRDWKGREVCVDVANSGCRSLMYVEADARMDSYVDKETNKNQTNLSLIASTYTFG